jgi:hypothetical protein
LQTQHTKITKENKQLKADNLFLKQQLAEIQHQFADKLALLEMKINKVAAVKNKPAASKNLLSVKK